MDIFSTTVLARVVEGLYRPGSFLLDMFFPNIQTEESEEIHFDVDKSKPKIAPFVSPLVAGKVMTTEGYETYSFKPAYIKDKRQFNPDIAIRRSIGEKIGGDKTGQQRVDAAVKRHLELQLQGLTLRMQWMASSALRTGSITITGENYPTKVMNFGRDASLTKALTLAARWGETGVSPLADIESWQGEVQALSGAAANTVVMDPKAWALFWADPAVKEHLHKDKLADASLRGGPIALGEGEYAIYRGTIGNTEFWTYSEPYVDDNGNAANFMPDYTVILGSRQRLEGVQAFGMIKDEKSGFKALQYFVKSWLEEDPALRWMLMQSAPIVVPYRPNASMCVTVR